MTSWDAWLKSWALHGRSPRLQRKIDASRRTIEDAMKLGVRLFAGLSGGKDSTAMVGLLEEAGALDRVPCVYAHSALSFPDTLATVEAIAEKINADLHVIEPADAESHVRRACAEYHVEVPQPPVGGFTEMDLLRVIPGDITERLKHLYRCCASGNMCIAWMYEHDYHGSFVGLRAEESRGRLLYARVYGSVYQNRKDDTWQICPLLGWSHDDVFGYIVRRGLPLHPYYRAAYELGGAGEHPGLLRVDLGITNDQVAALGAISHIARVYPEWFGALRRLRPELGRYV